MDFTTYNQGGNVAWVCQQVKGGKTTTKKYLHQHLNFQQEKVLFYFHRWENICKTHEFLCTILSERQKKIKKFGSVQNYLGINPHVWAFLVKTSRCKY